MNKVKKIGVLTSGGDSPGMNAAIRAVVRSAIDFELDIVGIRRGYNGLINGDAVALDSRSVSDIIQRGGTFLYTARCMEFMNPEGRQLGLEMAQKLGLDGLVVIGGDGSFRGAEKLSELGLPTVGIPGTIDNDIVCTEYSIGFDTACNIALEAVDRLRDTALSHEKCSLIEVMGRYAGHLALQVGVAAGATAVLVPEKATNIEKDICEKIREGRSSGKTHYIVIVAEGYKDKIDDIAKIIETQTDISTRVTVLGHIQRGGSPTVMDRVIAARMGYRAVDLLRKGIGNRIVAIKNNEVVDYNINEALCMKKSIDLELCEICKSIAK